MRQKQMNIFGPDQDSRKTEARTFGTLATLDASSQTPNERRPGNPGTLDFSRFWSLGSENFEPLIKQQASLDWKKDLAVLRGEEKVDVPVKYEFMRKPHKAQERLDFLSAAEITPLIFSKKFFSVLQKVGAVGFRRYPVEIQRKGGFIGQDYQGLIVDGRAGGIDNTLSFRAVSLPAFTGGPATPSLIGTFFQPDTWDGSDIFSLKNTSRVVVTEQLKMALEEAKLNGVMFTRLDLLVRSDVSARPTAPIFSHRLG